MVSQQYLRSYLDENHQFKQFCHDVTKKYSVTIIYPGYYDTIKNAPLHHKPLMSSGTLIYHTLTNNLCIITAAHVAKHVEEHDINKYIYFPGLNKRSHACKIDFIINSAIDIDLAIIILKKGEKVPFKEAWHLKNECIFLSNEKLHDYIWISHNSCFEQHELQQDARGPVIFFPHAISYFNAPEIYKSGIECYDYELHCSFIYDQIICYVDKEGTDKLPGSSDGASGAGLWCINPQNNHINLVGVSIAEEREYDNKRMDRHIFHGPQAIESILNLF